MIPIRAAGAIRSQPCFSLNFHVTLIFPVAMEVTAVVIFPRFDTDPAKVLAALRTTHVVTTLRLLHRGLSEKEGEERDSNSM